ncbi:hypothetical protein SHIRM173S_01237 [Streptomyces hirsutus]
MLARRRRTTTLLFVAFTLGAVVAAIGGLAFLWAPGVPAVLLSVYIAYLRTQEHRRFAYQMDRRQAEVAAQRLRERQPRRRAGVDDVDTDEPEGPGQGFEPAAGNRSRRPTPASWRSPPTGGRSWSRPTTPSGSTSSASVSGAPARAATAGTRSRSRCPRT